METRVIYLSQTLHTFTLRSLYPRYALNGKLVGSRAGLDTLQRGKPTCSNQTTVFGHHVHELVTILTELSLFPLQIIIEWLIFYAWWTGNYIKGSGRGPLHITLHNNLLEGLTKDSRISWPLR
jgi:hypothetical protein